MHRRTCAAAVLLCAPLVAGCGAARRVKFSSARHPAAPVGVSVLVGAGGIAIDPNRVRSGPVAFYITNQTHRTVGVVVVVRGGRTLVRSPAIPARGTAQFRASLTRGAVGIELAGRASSLRTLRLVGRVRSGSAQLTQP